MLFVVFVLMQVFRAGPITSYRIQGAVVAYLLIGLMWTYAYGLVYELVPGAFRFPEGASCGGKQGSVQDPALRRTGQERSSMVRQPLHIHSLQLCAKLVIR